MVVCQNISIWRNDGAGATRATFLHPPCTTLFRHHMDTDQGGVDRFYRCLDLWINICNRVRRETGERGNRDTGELGK